MSEFKYNGDLKVVGKLNITNDLDVDGKLNITDGLTISGSTIFSQLTVTDLDVNGSLNVTNDITVNGSTNFNKLTVNELFLGNIQRKSSSSINFKGSNPQRNSHIYYDIYEDWYIRSGTKTGNVFIQDNGGNVCIWNKNIYRIIKYKW